MRCHVPPRHARLRPPASCISFLLPLPFRSRCRRLACGTTLFRAYRMCARACVCAGAVRAPDCAREPCAGRTCPVRSVGVFFRTGARRETKRPPDAASSCLILPRFYRGQALTGNYFIIRERIAVIDHGPDAPVRPETDRVALRTGCEAGGCPPNGSRFSRIESCSKPPPAIGLPRYFRCQARASAATMEAVSQTSVQNDRTLLYSSARP